MMKASAELFPRRPEIWISTLSGESVTGKAETGTGRVLKTTKKKTVVNTRILVTSKGTDCTRGLHSLEDRISQIALTNRSDQRRAATSELNHGCLLHEHKGGFRLILQTARTLDNCSNR